MIELKDDNFKDVIENNPMTVIKFWAPWCAPCRTIKPIFDSLSHDSKFSNIAFCECNVEDAVDTTVWGNIRNVPTFLYIKNGKVIDRSVGMQDTNDFTTKLNKLVANV